MNDFDHDAFEQELRKARPAPASERLREAIASALDAPPPPPPSVPTKLIHISLWTSWGVAVAAAAVAMAVVLREDHPRRSPLPRTAPHAAATPEDAGALRVVPAGSAGYLYRARDEGVVMLENGAPARRVRYEFLDTFELLAPGGGGRVNVTYPREEIRVVPIRTF